MIPVRNNKAEATDPSQLLVCSRFVVESIDINGREAGRMNWECSNGVPAAVGSSGKNIRDEEAEKEGRVATGGLGNGRQSLIQARKVCVE